MEYTWSLSLLAKSCDQLGLVTQRMDWWITQGERQCLSVFEPIAWRQSTCVSARSISAAQAWKWSITIHLCLENRERKDVKKIFRLGIDLKWQSFSSIRWTNWYVLQFIPRNWNIGPNLMNSTRTRILPSSYRLRLSFQMSKARDCA
jgi:hypothetical protein